MVFFRTLLPNSFVRKKYVDAGKNFGNAVSYIYFGESTNLGELGKKWGKWEKEYAERGFRTISLDRFIEFGGYDEPIDDLLNQKRESGEDPIFHSDIYLEKYFGKVKPVIDIAAFKEGTKRTQSGTYELPTTELENDTETE